MAPRAFITGCSGPGLTAGERAFLRDARPCGLILFKRNCADPAQLERLVGEARAAAGTDDFLVLVDQEGGRVQRMGPPGWRDYPPAAAFGRLYARDVGEGLRAARAAARLMARDLCEMGIDTDCAPVLDVPAPGAHGIIGDRAYGADPDTVTALGRAVAEAMLEGGVLPVIKHMPGHGRARADSHLALPTVETPRDELERTDFAPFAALSDMPIAMSAHVVFTAIDEDAPASVSSPIMEQVIRGAIGFDGLVMSDDISMRALSGTLPERASAVLAAGSDAVLHCNGDLAEMTAIAGVVPELDGKPLARLQAALNRLGEPADFDAAEAEAYLEKVMGLTA